MRTGLHRHSRTPQALFMQRRNYDIYILSPKEWLQYSLLYTALFAVLDYLFYQQAVLMLLAIPFIVLMMIRQRKELIRKRRIRLNEQFRDALISLNVAVQAGYSIENAVSAAIKDLQQLYPKGSDILEEFQYIENQLYLSIPIDELFLDLAARTGIEDIENFATVFYTARKTGGDMSHMIEQVTRMLSDKIDVKKEIGAVLAAKQYEQTIMSLMPAGIIAYMRLTSPGYLDIMYGNLLGAFVMSVCLGIYGFAWLLGRRIVSIEV